jgi:deoxyadenosine/deoxycytidine kinase
MYLVEGNVGVGKSTLLSLIAKRLSHVQVVFESVNAWSNADHSNSLLTHFYQDTNRWSYTMETFTMFTRIKEHLNEQNGNNPFKIIERSLYSGHYCFARNGYLQGCMTDVEWSLYTQWFTFLVERGCKPPHGFIYLKADPQICYDRTLKRSRSGEESIPLSYFEQIHEQHENFLIKKQNVLGSLKEVPVLVLDASFEFENDEAVLEEYLQKIQDFMLITHKPSTKTSSVQL